MPSSWKDAASRYDKEQADRRQREAQEERKRAAELEEVAKVDRLVQDFLRSARSVGSPGAEQFVSFDPYDPHSEGWIPRGVRAWKWGSLTVQTDGLWGYYNHNRYNQSGGSWRCYMGRRPEGLHGELWGETTYDTPADDVQRLLVALMRKNGIPIPS